MTETINTNADFQNYQKAASAYQSSSTGDLNGFEIVVELYKGILKNIEAAKTAYQAGELEEMVRLNDKTNKILVALQSHLNFEQGGEAAIFLNSFYNQIFARIVRVLRVDDTAAEYDQIAEAVKPVYEIWCTHATNSRSVN
ncbi:MAG: flagellar protein FliS [Bdellovibrionales bacterium]